MYMYMYMYIYICSVCVYNIFYPTSKRKTHLPPQINGRQPFRPGGNEEKIGLNVGLLESCWSCWTIQSQHIGWTNWWINWWTWSKILQNPWMELNGENGWRLRRVAEITRIHLRSLMTTWFSLTSSFHAHSMMSSQHQPELLGRFNLLKHLSWLWSLDTNKIFGTDPH